ncbi:NAD-dependent dehydratase [Candidatus Endobugula sertula]|uniref:NAD-dependent dehydratase n=1 Tax=Candidatus Endobugula sertula TaxID=62101 RepID=A0A1D2QNF6_9GAMM|nr:NAD-dependent dehydratase [Candidatus Endobugula sertula]
MSVRILITGSSGLVGTALIKIFKPHDIDIKCFDLKETSTSFGDVRDRASVQMAVEGCDGVIHLAAVSRVVWAENDPELCQATNVDGISNVLEAAATSKKRPWVIFSSSREVYGQPESLPVTETFPLRPINVYARSKAESERLVIEAQRKGVKACIIRLSNVYGTTQDHVDRVVPAFVRAAILGERLRVDGASHTFDFTHVEDVARGIFSLSTLLSQVEVAPAPIHFTSGKPTTLVELAKMVIEIAGTTSDFFIAPSRSFDVSCFFGVSNRAQSLLGWKPKVSLETGIVRLVEDFSSKFSLSHRAKVMGL